MRHITFLTVMLGLVMPAIAQAQDSPKTPPVQSRIFALALTLRACDLRAQDYIESIQALKLKTLDDDEAQAEVKRRSGEIPRLRHAQSEAYLQAARLLTRLGAPSEVHDWAALAAERFKAPLVYDAEARKMAQTDPAGGRVMAELNELQTTQAASDSEQPTLAVWLKLTEGVTGLWTADFGSYTADLRRAAAAPGRSRLLGNTALHLLMRAPRGTPSGPRSDLAELVPAGGNLQHLSHVLPEATSREKISRVYAKIVDDYDARKEAEALDRAE